MCPTIAIDGPAASGKSTVARAVARRLGIIFASSGELYRAMTWAALEANILGENEEALNEFLSHTRISNQECHGKIVFFVNGEDLTQHLNDERVNKNVSIFSRFPKFRAVLLKPLRELGNSFPLVMEGRDIGSVVFPETSYKFYLDASVEERQRRRLNQGIADAIGDRDRLDSGRKVAPLLIPAGAYVLDTTDRSLEDVIKKILEVLKRKKFPEFCKLR